MEMSRASGAQQRLSDAVSQSDGLWTRTQAMSRWNAGGTRWRDNRVEIEAATARY
ncbi:hypothetical protein IG631_07351 [Alternaria alternata]|nr:hypothetical protein IG631_07351 [Alternaria alternata]